MTVDKVVKEQLYLDNEYVSGTYKSVRAALLEAMNKIENRLLKVKDKHSKRQLNELYREINKQINNAYKPLPKMLAKENLHLQKYIFADNTGDMLPLDAIRRMMRQDPDVLGYSYKDLFSAQSDTHARRIKTTVAAGIAAGQHPASLVPEIRSINNRLTKNQLKTAINTATSVAVHEARYAAYRSFEDNEPMYQSVATLDSRTTEICRKLDGKKYKMKLEDIPNKPPRHFNCRSVLIPVVPGHVAATRASIDGPVEGSVTYAEWEKARPKNTSNTLRPVRITGKKTLESIQWSDLAFGAAIESGLRVDKIRTTETSTGFYLTAKTGGFEMQIQKDEDMLVLRQIVLPEKYRRKGIGTDIVNGLKAIVNTYGLKGGKIVAGSKEYPDGAYIWLSSGLARPSNKFKGWLYDRLKEAGFGQVELYEVSKYLDNEDYRGLLTKSPYAGDIKGILKQESVELRMI